MRRQTINRLILILLITILALWINFTPFSEEQRFLGRDVHTRLGLDLKGGVQVRLRPRDPNASQQAVEDAATTIEQRVNGLGLTEALVQTAGNGEYIVVEIPDVDDPQRAIETIQGTGTLEFIDPQGQYLPEGTAVCTSNNPQLPAPINADQPADETGAVTPTQTLSDTAALTETQETAAVTATEGVTATETVTGTNATEGDQRECDVIYETIAEGNDLDRDSLLVTSDARGSPAVAFKLTGDAATALQSFTARNVGQPMTIVLDNYVISSATIQDMLPGEGIITFGAGSPDQQRQEAETLLNQLRYGALPVPLEVESALEVTATLGDASVQASQIAGVIGLLAVALFMLIYYGVPGLLADIALLIYTAILFAIYRYLPITLTLPGIAGFILSIGLAVDANVLIFARLKEELRIGRSLRTAVENGFHHAWPSIRDSNASTFITSVILFMFGNSFGVSLVKGFALTLMIGVAVSLFTAIYVTRTFLRMLVEFGWVENPRWFGADKPKTEGEISA